MGFEIVTEVSRINKQRELEAFNRQGTLQQRPESSTVTPPDMRVNTGYINSTEAVFTKLYYFARTMFGAVLALARTSLGSRRRGH